MTLTLDILLADIASLDTDLDKTRALWLYTKDYDDKLALRAQIDRLLDDRLVLMKKRDTVETLS